MTDEPRVWIRTRACKKGKTTYHLRWIDPASGKWRSRKVGSDRKRAEYEATKLEDQLAAGTYRPIRRVTWAEFVKEHIDSLPGERNATLAKRALDEFGEVLRVPLKGVTYGMVEAFVEHLRARGRKADDKRPTNNQATINHKLRYLRAAFAKGIRRGYITKNPMEGWQWVSEDRKAPRIASQDDEKALLAAAEELYGSRFRAFLYVALNTGGRTSELHSLTWDHVDFKRERIHFADTKGKRDRYVPITPEVAGELRRLQAQTLQEGGPFVGMAQALGKRWRLTVKKAEVKHITPHDLRRTYVTRLIRAGVPLPTVQKLAGHADIQTTLEYYNWVSDDDLREGVAKLRAAQAAG